MKKKYKRLKINIFFLLLLVNAGCLMVFNDVVASSCTMKGNEPQCPAGTSIKIQIPLPNVGVSCDYNNGASTLHCVEGFPAYLLGIYNLFIGVVGILAVIMIMLGGFQWLIAAGNAQKIAGAKTTIISAIMGLVLALTSFTILNLINPQISVLRLTADEITPPENSNSGFCSADFKYVDGNSGFACGYSYDYYSMGDIKASCSGYQCDNKKTEICVITNVDTNNQLTAGCKNGIQIDGSAKDYPNEVWKFSENVNSIRRAECGYLYYKSIAAGSNGKVGIYCDDSKYCVINEVDGYKIVVNKDDNDGSQIGRFNNFFCIK